MELQESKLPKHVGIIMDGNGRWANLRGKKRSFGHRAGAKNVDTIVSYAFERGVYALTLYTFSCENWARPKEEVDELMRLLKIYFTKYIKKILKNNVRLVVVGDKSAFTDDLREIIDKDEEASKNNNDHVLMLAINYGGRQEIVTAVNKLVKENKEITVESISDNLYTAPYGEPDLIIRTGGEIRLSNFLLYQGAYSELYFSDVLWPDFHEKELDDALRSFSERKRRYGRI